MKIKSVKFIVAISFDNNTVTSVYAEKHNAVITFKEGLITIVSKKTGKVVCMGLANVAFFEPEAETVVVCDAKPIAKSKK